MKQICYPKAKDLRSKWAFTMLFLSLDEEDDDTSDMADLQNRRIL